MFPSYCLCRILTDVNLFIYVFPSYCLCRILTDVKFIVYIVIVIFFLLMLIVLIAYADLWLMPKNVYLN